MLDKQKQALLAIDDQHKIYLLPRMANRHGLITGATGTGKTVTVQTMAETFSQMGVPVFAADVKGDLSGVAGKGGGNPGVEERVQRFKLIEQGFAFQGFPVQFWDVFGVQGAPLRGSIAELGPLMLSRMLALNDTQSGLLSMLFKIGQDEKLPLVDVKDLQKLLEYAAQNSARLAPNYGNLPASSLGAIQRNLLTLAHDGVELLFGEPSLNLDDLMQAKGDKGVINLLAADRLMASPRVYSTFLLWLLNRLFAILPEVGDQEKPKLVFFFDEAHLLFSDIGRPLLEKVEQTVRMIRSKGVGIYFISQSSADIPDSVLGQLGNRVQHALRAYTPGDQKKLKAAAQSFRVSQKFDIEQAITSLGIGEALVSLLEENGAPAPTARAFVVPPQGQIGPLDEQTRQAMLKSSLVYRYYTKAVDNVSAYELLSEKMRHTANAKEQAAQQKTQEMARRQEERQRETALKQEKRDARQRKNFWSGIAKSTLVPLIRQFLRSLFKK